MQSPRPENPDASRSDTLENGLTIIIPAYNEEEAIESIIRRCLDARDTILQAAGLETIRIIVVDDGSRDRTRERASRFLPHITLLKHEHNQGYGAAIKYGFRESRTTLVGFLDADGTCDPLRFAEFCRVQKEMNADVVSGSRMGPQSEMPAVRRLGNRIFALLLAALARKKIQDTASGMRVLKAESLRKIYPLPDGLHFTPAMTARILFKPGLSLCEVPMPYAERIGKSKLNVLKDGIRFLRVILEMALIYKPLQFFGAVAALLFLIGLSYLPGLILDAIRLGVIPEDRIYRMLGIITFFVGGLMLLGVGFLGQKAALLLHGDIERYPSFYNRILRRFAPAGIGCILIGIGINIAPLREYVSLGKIHYSWIYIAGGALLVLGGLQMLSIAILDYVLDLVVRHQVGKE